MKKGRTFTLIVLAMLLIFGSFATAQMKDKDHSGHSLTAKLTGPAEVPGPGDADGAGTINITLNQGKGEVCFDITVSNIGEANAVHIHEGVAGKAGPPVVTLTPAPASGSSKNCVAVDQAVVKKIQQNPENYYVNVHNAEFPDGAVRGQLGKGK